MSTIKKYLAAIVFMLVITMFTLVIITTFTYIFKWQADKAMIGIVATYIFAGLTGGICLKNFVKKENRIEQKNRIANKLLEAWILSTVFFVCIKVLSVLVLQNAFVFSGRFFLIWILLFASTFLGRVL